MDEPNVPRAMAQCADAFQFNLLDTWFFVGREKVLSPGSAPASRMAQAAFYLHAAHRCSTRRNFPHPQQPGHRVGGQIEI